MELPIHDWVHSELLKIPNVNVERRAIDLLLGSSTVIELEEHLGRVLNKKVPTQQKAYKSLFSKIVLHNNLAIAPSDFRIYKKSELADDQPCQKSKFPSESNAQPSQSEDRKFDEKSSQCKRKVNFVPLFTTAGKAVIPGRHRCDCQASKHNLVNNCLNCGRIVCEQEGSGPCVFCGSLVCTAKEMEVLVRNSRKSENLMKRLYGVRKSEQDSPGLEKAQQHKDKLLNFDKTCEKRTRVIDDQSDYFVSDSRWLTPAEKAVLKQKEEEYRSRRHAPRSQRKYKFDFAGREVKDDDDLDLESMTQRIDEIYVNKCKVERSGATLLHPNIPMGVEFVEVQLLGDRPEALPKVDSLLSRIQDRGLMEMLDEGYCLSMHQPYASLLVAGIKRHEGRTWYTPHRGRLWIASTGRIPASQDIKEVEHFYSKFYDDPNIEFPESYPSGCLLGCVHVSECLPQEEYRTEYPEGESDSPYVFICENTIPLAVKMPIQGKHKIYKMDPLIHKACRDLIK